MYKKALIHLSCNGLNPVRPHQADSAAASRPDLPSTLLSLRHGEWRSTTTYTSPIVRAVCGQDISVK